MMRQIIFSKSRFDFDLPSLTQPFSKPHLDDQGLQIKSTKSINSFLFCLMIDINSNNTADPSLILTKNNK